MSLLTLNLRNEGSETMIRQIVLHALTISFALIPAVGGTTTTTRSKQEVRLGNAPTPNVVTPPKLVSYTRPMYTDEGRRQGIEGKVTLEAEFDAQGNFRVLRVVKGLGYGLDENALTALKKWRFTPAYRDGQRVRVVMQIDVNFSLFDDPQWLLEQNRLVERPKINPFGKSDWGIESIRRTVERWETN